MPRDSAPGASSSTTRPPATRSPARTPSRRIRPGPPAARQPPRRATALDETRRSTTTRPSPRGAPARRKRRAPRITDAWAEQEAVREIVVFPAPARRTHRARCGSSRPAATTRSRSSVGTPTGSRGPSARSGFKLADIDRDEAGRREAAATRVRAGIGHALDEATKGHCGLPVDERRPLAAELLEVDEPGPHRARHRAGCLREERESHVTVEDVLHRDAAPTRRSTPNAGSKPRIRRAGLCPGSGVNWSTCSTKRSTLA